MKQSVFIAPNDFVATAARKVPLIGVAGVSSKHFGLRPHPSQSLRRSTRTHLFRVALAMIGLLGSLVETRAATFNIADGDVAGLINAINTANTNGEDDVINLAGDGVYT